MGPERVLGSNSRRLGDQSPSREHRRRHKHGTIEHQQKPSASEPGVQKLKAALRQARRLLAKDNLAADVRRDTERRLKSLESDLQSAELKRKERALAKRYHKVKFFERTKVLRKIKKVKRELEQERVESSKEALTQLENMLFELRAQLNYISNYPKLEKYISLFPPSKEKDAQNPDLGDAGQPSQSATDARREEILSSIKNRMLASKLSGEPELEVEGGSSRASAGGATRKTGHGTSMRGSSDTGGPRSSLVGPMAKGKPIESNAVRRADEDDFFDKASDSDSESDGIGEGD